MTVTNSGIIKVEGMVRDMDIRLKMLRIAKRKTQKQVAQETGISSTVLSGYEQGASSPSNKNLAKLAVYYDVSTDYLLGIEKRRQLFLGATLTDEQFEDVVALVGILVKNLKRTAPNLQQMNR